MKFTETKHPEHKVMSSVEYAERARGYVNRMVEKESRGWGDQGPALGRIETRYGIPYWTLEHLRKWAKTCETSLFHRIRAAYLHMCEQQVLRAQHEILVEKASGEFDDDLASLEAEAAALAARIQAKKEARR